MKRTALALTLILALSTSLLAGIPTVKPAAADSGIHGNLTMISPNSQTAYTDTMLVDLTIAWSVSLPIPWMHVKVSYSIDDGPTIAITNESSIIFQRSSSIVYTQANSLAGISNLADGKHKLTIIAEGDYNVNNDFVFPLNYSFAPIYFYVNILTPPDILIVSPQNKSYNVANTPLSFKIDTPTSWIGYSLDSQNNETIGGNTTLTGLIDGSHSLVIYANDTVGNMGASQTVTFTIAIPPKISILSPLNQTYTESNVPLIFTLDKPVNCTCYSLDGQDNVTLTGNTTLTVLSGGSHNITFYAIDTYGNTGASATVNFTIALVIEVLSPERRTYDTSSIPLNFTVNEAVSQITYCLDGEENITISGNTTLTGLANGDHTLTIYAKDEVGNVGTSETILFTVDVPFPTTLVVAASGASIAVAAAGLLFYFKKRKH